MHHAWAKPASRRIGKGLNPGDGILQWGHAFESCALRQGVIHVMQGLIISSQDSSKKEEAYDLAKKGIKNNLRSHVTWHVFG